MNIEAEIRETRAEVRAIGNEFTDFRRQYRQDQLEQQRVLARLVESTAKLDERYPREVSSRKQQGITAGIATALATALTVAIDLLSKR